MRRKFVLVCSIAIVVASLGWQAAAFAYGPTAPSITTSSSAVYPGNSLLVQGQNFARHESITISLHPGGILGRTSTNRRGSFSIEVTIPSNTQPGTYTITATGSTGDSASTGITVNPTSRAHHHRHHRHRF